jgi:hypothetical protein
LLYKTLIEGTIVERKAFIRSFIKKITVGYPTVEIEYTIPLDKEKKLDKEVLVINKLGWGERIRTDKALNITFILFSIN